MMKHYIEIIRYEDDQVVKRVDVSNRTETARDRVENGMNINLNHAQYYTSGRESEVELPLNGDAKATTT
ncbi:hypothetical protein LEM8419_03520 [Neolewinella maritima]|uniref:DUF3892 domain-containing protein n=1 Tax=Neolewinella maritima TaxID=1383882 RepID=A0ABM9B5G6_9BACT|nr:hypothetical protein LEM8419_03520 [Neolewinella maritima]